MADIVHLANDKGRPVCDTPSLRTTYHGPTVTCSLCIQIANLDSAANQEIIGALENIETAIKALYRYPPGSEAQADEAKTTLFPAIDQYKVAIEMRYPGKLTEHL